MSRGISFHFGVLKVLMKALCVNNLISANVTRYINTDREMHNLEINYVVRNNKHFLANISKMSIQIVNCKEGLGFLVVLESPAIHISIIKHALRVL